MPYLAINNYAVPCQGASTGFKEAGSRGYNQAGRYFLNRAGRDKREWKFETAPLSNDDAQGLIGMLQMRGEHFPFAAAAVGNGSSGTQGAARSQKGLVQTANVYVQAPSNRAADGGLVYIRGTRAGEYTTALAAPYSDFSNNSSFPYQAALWPHKGFQNVLSTNNANPELLGHLTAWGGGTLATETDRRWTGTGCVRWNPGAVNQGVRTDNNLTLGNLTRYVASAYVKGSVANQTVLIRGNDNSGVFLDSLTVTLPASTDIWTRIWAAGTTANPSGATSFMGVISSTDPPQPFYIDGLQLCAVTSITNPGPWLAGQTTATQMQLEYNNAFLRDMRDGLTVNAWVYRIDSSYATEINITGAASNVWQYALTMLAIDSTGRARFYLADGTDLSRNDVNFTAVGTTVLDSAWHMLTGTWDPSTQTARIYVDGVLEGTDTINSFNRTVDWWDPAGLLTYNATTGYWGAVGDAPGSAGALISHLSILPYVASANIIDGWYGTPAATDPPLSFFPLTCSGDFLASEEKWISAFGEVTDVENVEAAIPPASPGPGVWNDNLKKVKFTLTEA